ncbi:hypothetical protein KAU09_05500 [Candidatus Parcubacteria bacterium]|nr:hypothetical protein [Candidatus Parcubacteria bacterium]
MPNTLDFNSISSNLRQSKNSSDGGEPDKKSGALNKIPGVGDAADIGGKLRQGKLGAVAEKSAGMAIKSLAPGIGTAALKVGKATGIPVEKIILFAVIGLLLFLILIILAGGYAMTHKWDMLKFWWLS